MVVEVVSGGGSGGGGAGRIKKATVSFCLENVFYLRENQQCGH